MTTYEKIKALVQSYVDELFVHDDMSDQKNIENRNDALVMCMAFTGHILETHCIVPKATLNKHFIEMANDYATYLNPDNNSNREMIKVDSLGFLNWVLEKYCIAEKSKVKALYFKMELNGNHVDSDNDWAIYEAMDELEIIFGKELFEKEK